MKNFTFKVIGEAGIRLLSTVFLLFLARSIGAAEFGRYSSAFAYAAIFMIVVDLGTNAIVTREIARHQTDRKTIIGSTNALKFLASLVAFTSAHVVALLNHWSSEQIQLVDALTWVLISYTLSDYFATLLNGKEEMGWEAALKIGSRLCVTALGLMALYQHRSLVSIAEWMGYGAWGSLLFGGTLIAARFGSFGFSFNRTWMKTLLRSSLPLFGAVVFWLLYDNQDILLLNYFKISNDQIGLFSSAIKIIDVLKVFPVLLTSVSFPVLARLSSGPAHAFNRKARSLIFWTICSFPFIVGGVYGMAPTIMNLLYGHAYVGATPLLRILLPAYVGISMNHVALHLLIAKDHERHLLVGASLAWLSNLLFAYFLIPSFGPSGVCYALLGSELIYFLFQAGLLMRLVPDLFAREVPT